MQNKSNIEIPDEIRVVIEEIINAYNEKRLVSVMSNNPTLTINNDTEKLQQKKIIFQIVTHSNEK